MTDEPEDTSPIGRLLLACGFTESGITYRFHTVGEGAREGVMLDEDGSVLCRFYDEFDVPVRFADDETPSEALARWVDGLQSEINVAVKKARQAGLTVAVEKLGGLFSEVPLNVDLSPFDDELRGVMEKYFLAPAVDRPSHQPDYMRHDPTKQHKRRKRR